MKTLDFKSAKTCGKFLCDRCAHACFSIVHPDKNETSVRCAASGFQWQPKVGSDERCRDFKESLRGDGRLRKK